MIDPEKYVVFKRDEYQGQPLPEIDDAVVIRLQDIFAAGALYTYANSIRTAVEIMSQRSPLENRDITEIEYLNELADYFMEMAAKAESTGNKVPD